MKPAAASAAALAAAAVQSAARVSAAEIAAHADLETIARCEEDASHILDAALLSKLLSGGFGAAVGVACRAFPHPGECVRVVQEEGEPGVPRGG